jgi:hypothetical protein
MQGVIVKVSQHARQIIGDAHDGFARWVLNEL